MDHLPFAHSDKPATPRGSRVFRKYLLHILETLKQILKVSICLYIGKSSYRAAFNKPGIATYQTLKGYSFALGKWTIKHTKEKIVKPLRMVKRSPWIEEFFVKIEPTPPKIIYP